MARTPEGTKHPALLAKRRQAQITGVEAPLEWSMLGYDQQQFLSLYLVSGDAYDAATTSGKSLEWVNQQMANDDFVAIIEQVRSLPSEYAKDLAKQRLPAALERLWELVGSKNDNTARAAIKDWMTVAGLVKGDLPPGSTVNTYNVLNNIKPFGNQPPAMNKDELFNLEEVEDGN